MYRDAEGCCQGPFDTAKMRGWFEYGYFSEQTLVSPQTGSPSERKWHHIFALWDHPSTQAFIADIHPWIASEAAPAPPTTNLVAGPALPASSLRQKRSHDDDDAAPAGSAQRARNGGIDKEIPATGWIEDMLLEREKARFYKNWQKADKIRDDLLERGVRLIEARKKGDPSRWVADDGREGARPSLSFHHKGK